MPAPAADGSPAAEPTTPAAHAVSRPVAHAAPPDADRDADPESARRAPTLAHDGYAYGFPEAPDCNEATLGTDCVGDDRGFFQGQCTSWVAHRLSQRNGICFSNWYAGRHWGDAVDWKVAK